MQGARAQGLYKSRLAREEPRACGSRAALSLDPPGDRSGKAPGGQSEAPRSPQHRRASALRADLRVPPAEVNLVGGRRSRPPGLPQGHLQGSGAGPRETQTSPTWQGRGRHGDVTARACAGGISRRLTLVGAVKRGRSRSPAFPGTFYSLCPASFPSPFPAFWCRDPSQLLWLLPRCRRGGADRGALGGP